MAVEVPVMEKTAEGEEEPIAVRPTLSIWKKVEEADSRLVKKPKAKAVASLPETRDSLAIPVEVPIDELRVVEVARSAGTSR